MTPRWIDCLSSSGRKSFKLFRARFPQRSMLASPSIIKPPSTRHCISLTYVLLEPSTSERISQALALQIHRHREGKNSYQARLNVGRHQGGTNLAKQARSQLQLDPHVFAPTSHRRRRSWCLPHLSFRWPNSRLVQGCHEERLLSPRRSRREQRPSHLQLLQEIWLQNHRYGGKFQKQGRDHRAGWLRLFDHFGTEGFLLRCSAPRILLTYCSRICSRNSIIPKRTSPRS